MLKKNLLVIKNIIILTFLSHLSGLQELSFEGKEIKVSKYLDSFPFPYYIVLRNIEALPRTLADLLRQVTLFSCKPLDLAGCCHHILKIVYHSYLQWFELMQYTRE